MYTMTKEPLKGKIFPRIENSGGGRKMKDERREESKDAMPLKPFGGKEEMGEGYDISPLFCVSTTFSLDLLPRLLSA